jgi:hypothetical protein
MADLNIARATFFRSRGRLSKCGILNFKSINGTPNVTYNLTDLELIYRDRNKSIDPVDDPGNAIGIDPGVVTGSDTLNKNSKPKPKPKQAAVITYADVFNFFADTGNCRLLKEKFGLDDAAIAGFFKVFYDSKIDLGDLNNKTPAETARNFYYWLPKHLAAEQREKEKNYAKKESVRQPGKQQPLRGLAVAMKFAAVKMRGDL